MKKLLMLFLSIVILLSLSACTVVTELLNPLKLTDKKTCTDCTIKTSISTYPITPVGFDFEELNKRGYKMSIKVTYDAYYTKDWDVPWDIGYLGAPGYEVSILDDDLIGNIDANITATLTSTTRTLTYTTDVVNLVGSKIYLTFSSDNIQNILHFENISITYTCFK